MQCGNLIDWQAGYKCTLLYVKKKCMREPEKCYKSILMSGVVLFLFIKELLLLLIF